MSGPLDVARAAWGLAIPDWVEMLAVECGRTSQSDVAGKLDRSGAVISQVLRNKYPARTDAIEERVRGVFQNASVPCPGLGEVTLHECQDWRAKSRHFALGNPRRAQMYRACNACPRNRKEDAE